MENEQQISDVNFDYFPRIPALMSPAEIAVALGVSAASISRLLASGRFIPVKIKGEDPVYLRSDVIKYIQQNFLANDIILPDYPQEKEQNNPE